MMIIIVVIIVLIPKPITVGKHDSVEIDYIVWESDEAEIYNLLSPIFDATVWVTMIPITENDTTGLTLGLYNNLLGKGKFYESGLIWLNRCIDQNRDGIDDNTGQPALTYGNSTDQYFNTSLMIQFTILDIQKFTPSFNEIDIGNNVVLRIIVYIIIAVVVVLVALLAVFFIRDRIQKSKAKPRIFYRRLRTYKAKILKYSVLAGSLTLISYLFLGVWLGYSPGELGMMISRYSFLIPLLITITIIICVGFTIVYLFVYRIIVDKILRKSDVKKG